MELVGRYISVVEKKDEPIRMDFACSNKEIFREIVVPPALKSISSGLIRIWVHRLADEDTLRPSGPLILNHWEEIE